MVRTAVPGCGVSWLAPRTLDNCSLCSGGSAHQSGDVFPLGTPVVTYEISDPSGNTISDSFSITVEDTQAPDFLTFVSSTVLENDPGECGAVHTWGVPEVFENCPELEVYVVFLIHNCYEANITSLLNIKLSIIS